MDKIIQTNNDSKKQIMNGEVGKIESIDPMKKEVLCDFGGCKKVAMTFSDFKAFVEPAWAITSHKSQGSEYKRPIHAISPQHSSMIDRFLLFTVFTRAKELSGLVGDFKVIEKAILNTDYVNRQTTLTQRIDLAISEAIQEKADEHQDSLNN